MVVAEEGFCPHKMMASIRCSMKLDIVQDSMSIYG